MKRNIKLLLSLLFGAVIMFTACEEDERPYGTADPNGDLATTTQISNIDELWAFSLDPVLVGTGYTYTKYLSVHVLGTVPTTDANITFSIIDTLFINEDTVINTAVEGTQYTLSNSTVITIPAGSNTGSVAVTVYPDEIALGTSATICWEITGGDLTFTELGLTSSFTMFRNCPLDYNLFNGIFDNPGNGTVSVVKQDANIPNRIWVTEVWTGSDSCYLDIDADGIISAENQFTMQHDVYGLGRVMFEDIWGEVTDNCTPVFEFHATPTLPDSGYWWGGEFDFVLTKISDKTDIETASSLIKDRGVPFKY